MLNQFKTTVSKFYNLSSATGLLLVLGTLVIPHLPVLKADIRGNSTNVSMLSGPSFVLTDIAYMSSKNAPVSTILGFWIYFTLVSHQIKLMQLFAPLIKENPTIRTNFDPDLHTELKISTEYDTVIELPTK